MFAALVLNYRLALFFLVVPNLGTAVALAFGWARVLPEEPPPFGNAEDSFGRIKNMPSADELRSKRRDPFAIVLLRCVTLSHACQFPGVPGDMGFGSIPTVIPYDTGGWIEFAVIWFLVVIPGFATAYSFLRPNFLRVPLIVAAFLLFLLWLLGGPLFLFRVSATLWRTFFMPWPPSLAPARPQLHSNLAPLECHSS